MNCKTLSTLFVRANGEIVCEDDNGLKISLGEVFSTDEWSIGNIFDNEKYQHIRKALAMGFPP